MGSGIDVKIQEIVGGQTHHAAQEMRARIMVEKRGAQRRHVFVDGIVRLLGDAGVDLERTLPPRATIDDRR